VSWLFGSFFNWWYWQYAFCNSSLCSSAGRWIIVRLWISPSFCPMPQHQGTNLVTISSWNHAFPIENPIDHSCQIGLPRNFPHLELATLPFCQYSSRHCSPINCLIFLLLSGQSSLLCSQCKLFCSIKQVSIWEFLGQTLQIFVDHLWIFALELLCAWFCWNGGLT